MSYAWLLFVAVCAARQEAIGVTTSPGYADLLLNMGHLQAGK